MVGVYFAQWLMGLVYALENLLQVKAFRKN
uniref:Uncharacterized protein n=1 Tax=Rhizophora mucronata TaxID=61149 RepID=A0A2P2P2Q0_RHIMU